MTLQSIDGARQVRYLDCHRLAAQALVALAHGARLYALSREQYDPDRVGQILVTASATSVEHVRRMLAHPAVDLQVDNPHAEATQVQCYLADYLLCCEELDAELDALAEKTECDFGVEWMAVVKFVRAHWQQVEAIGGALLTRKHLSPEEIAELTAFLPPLAPWPS